MERFGDGLKTAAGDAAAQKLEAIVVNTALTSVPIVWIAAKPAMEMKKAIMAYSIAVAPRPSNVICHTVECIAGYPAIPRRR